MRVAFFSPLPPSKSGIADYSAALLERMQQHAQVSAFADASAAFDPSRFDIALYQIGNNACHIHAYEVALKHPGVVVLHEANLHHLICDLTIRRNNWDAYVAEAEYNGGAAARQWAERVRALEVGPDYDGVPMLRRLLEHALAVIVHSDYAAAAVRAAGFRGPLARIPHGAWLPDPPDRMAYRHRLGLSERTPLIGIFGFLKPYKRIAESLRAFRRLVRLEPEAKMILVGEPHPELPLNRLIAGLGLEPNVRVLGFTPIEDFMGYMGACDVIVNLRYPTVGETSGTLLRALGLGKPVLVSEVGAFCEYPDGVVLKVPVDAAEEDLLFEYLNLLVSRPSVAREIGVRARRWVEAECNWERVAKLYLSFLEAVRTGAGDTWQPEPPALSAAKGESSASSAATAEVQAGQDRQQTPDATEIYLRGWATTAGSRQYLETHMTRLRRTLEITPPGTPADRILEMGAYMQLTPALKTRLGYGEVRGCYLGPAGKTEHKRAVSLEGEEFACTIDLFNAEKDRFPYPDGYFATVICGELIEHLSADPMFMLSEINRVLRQGGHLVLTTPNIGSLRAISAILQGYHPGFFPAYLRPESQDEARHNREYTPKEIALLLLAAGFEITLLETGPFRDAPRPEDHWVLHLLERYLLPTELRGDGIYAVGRKKGPVKERYPAWLYQ